MAQRVFVSLHTYVIRFWYWNGIRRAISPFSLKHGVPPREKFSALRDYSVWETRRKVCGRTDTNGTVPTAGEFHRNIRDHLRYFQRVGLCPAGGKEKARERRRKRRERKRKRGGGESIDIAPRSPFRKKTFSFLASPRGFSPCPYFSYEYRIFASL